MHGFLQRYLDTGFKSKWSGYWVPPYKFLDYFSFKINGVWLNSETLGGVEYGEDMVFHHETDSLTIKEKLTTPEGFPGLRVELEVENKTREKKAVQTVMETGIDIRPKDQDVLEEDYSLEIDSGRILAEREGKKLVIEPKDVSGFKDERYVKEHYPEERQKCLVPEKPVFRREIDGEEKETITVEFKTSEAALNEIESHDQILDHDLGRGFRASISSMENLTYGRNGIGVIAGHPWFESYWARDCFWTALGLIDAGYFETTEKMLENFADHGLSDKIELEEDIEEPIERADTAPLYIIASEKLRKHHKLTGKIEEAREEAMEKLSLDGNIVDHSPDATWMDTLKRKNAVEIQSLWLEAAEIMGDSRAEKLREGLEEFKKNGMLRDELNGGHKTINPAVPLMFEHLDQDIASKQLEKINGEFSSKFGARTRSMADPGYDSSGYHTGSVWGLTTCWAAAANIAYGKGKEGKNLLEKLDLFLDREQPGALPETVDAESGELLGAPEQAWSAGLFVHAVDSYLLGIEVEENYVKIDPVADLNCRRTGKRVRGETLDLDIVDGEVEVLNDPDLDLRL